MTTNLKMTCRYCGREMELDDFDKEGGKKIYWFICPKCNATVRVEAKTEWAEGESEA